ncbi:hypothetical protein BH10PAT3_BH10PAT3_6910 [soil metagenome]
MIKAIVFDCFGVLAEDGWTPFKNKYITSGSAMAKKIAGIGRRTDLGTLDYKIMITEISALLGTEPALLRKAVEGKVSNKELFKFIESDLKPKYKIGLISNASYDVMTRLFNEEQAAVFDTTVLSYETKLTKPDPEMYALTARLLGVSLRECLFVDDQERHCKGAEATGASAILYTSILQLKKDLKIHFLL